MSEYDDNEYDDSGERMVSELEDLHSTLKEILSTLKSRADLFGLFWVVIVILVLEAWPGSKLDRWTDRAWYSFRYDADFKNVTVDKRPWTAISFTLHWEARVASTRSVQTSSPMSSGERSSSRGQLRKSNRHTQSSQTQ